MCTFRVNYIKSSDAEIEKALIDSDIDYKKIEVLTTHAYVIKDDSFDRLKDIDIYKDGKIYVQNPSSMLPSIYLLQDEKIQSLIKDKKNIDLLDMCASPGGKTLTLQSLSVNAFNITALERDKKRYERMVHNFTIQDTKAFAKHISAYDIDDFLRFDVVLLDAPCTGCDTDEKDVDVAYLSKLVSTQRKLIDKAKKILKKDGILMYSTCSVLEKEDEKQVEYAIGVQENTHVISSMQMIARELEQMSDTDYEELLVNQRFYQEM
ncbi:MAG: hypothetical protein MJ151_01945, partial [Lachnospiraceae bacterium]|nr:hypothetical protein [Lachnospiraceae bacterium]